MKILVLGAGGMLGHKMLQTLGRRFEAWGAIREPREAFLARAPWADGERLLDGVDVMDLDHLEHLLERQRFDAVINCIGVIKQRSSASLAIPSITINSLLPHRLAASMARWGGRVVHFSTDCVFSGRRGAYGEEDDSDAEDLYGKSKFLGEVALENALTLRTSIIGRELQHHHSLLDWFLQQQGGQIRGYRRALWSGVTTNHLADLVGELLVAHPSLHGLYQVSSGTISKYDLLILLRERFGLDIEILPDDEVACDRSLRGDRLRDAIGYECPPWETLLTQLADDPTPYPIPVPAHGSP